MIVEAGKFYETNGGERRGPMEWRSDCGDFVDPKMDRWWKKDGSCGGHAPGGPHDIHHEIIASPIREITRKEIVSGTYGIVGIGEVGLGIASVAFWKLGVTAEYVIADADELDAAASVLTQIAAVLRENGK